MGPQASECTHVGHVGVGRPYRPGMVDEVRFVILGRSKVRVLPAFGAVLASANLGEIAIEDATVKDGRRVGAPGKKRGGGKGEGVCGMGHVSVTRCSKEVGGLDVRATGKPALRGMLVGVSSGWLFKVLTGIQSSCSGPSRST